MLKGISPLISPDLIGVLMRMGHGDEIVLADAHFPGESFSTKEQLSGHLSSRFSKTRAFDPTGIWLYKKFERGFFE